MPKKQTYEEKVIADAAQIIMQTIHVASFRIADKYERMLMDEVVTRIQTQLEAKEQANKFTRNFLNDKIDNLSKE